MNVSAQLVMEMVRSHGLNRLAAHNMAGTDQLYYKEARSADELCKEVEICEASIDGPYRLEVWSGERGQGRKAVGAQLYKFILAGRNSYRPGGGDGDRVDKLCALVEKLVADRAAEDDEPEPQSAAINEKFMDLAIRGLERIIGGAPSPAPVAAIGAAPATATAVGDMSQAEAENLLTAAARWRMDSPAEYEQMKSLLLTKYPPSNGQGK